MKTILKIFLFGILFFISCNKAQILLFDGDDHIQFVNHVNDSTLHTFLSNPEADEMLIPLYVELVGKPKNKDREFKVSVVERFSTADEKHYSLESRYYLGAGKVRDTIYFKGIKTLDLSSQPVKLVLNVSGMSELKSGQEEYSNAILYLSNVISKPNWWTDNVDKRLLGVYSDKKYKLFIQLTGVIDVDINDEASLREYSIIMKNYLLKEKDAERTVYEDNGIEMTVAIIGG